jgi:protein-S-isoprenylcysteine O-methyltransferase Ste14
MNPDRTGIVIPPPVLFAFPFFAGWWIGRRWEWSMLSDRPSALAVGAGFVIAGFVIAIAGVRQFRAARTTVLPFGGTSRMVISGVYRWTRKREEDADRRGEWPVDHEFADRHCEV